MSETALANTAPKNVKEYLALPAYRDRFNEVLGKKANQFMAAIVAVSQLPSLKDAEPRSVIAAAMTAATLDLPVNPTLGMAYIVAYGDGNGQKVAQFQAGYKAYIQLALRSGQYKRLNSGPVNEGVFAGYDTVGEPMLDWTKLDPVAPAAGYFCAFETVNGFTKIEYWPKAKVEAHAKRFSKAYAKGWSTPWKTDFDAMATKTVIKSALTKWGILSIDMQKAATHDEAVVRDVGAEPELVDSTIEPAGEPTQTNERPPARARATRGAAAVRENSPVVEAQTSAVNPDLEAAVTGAGMSPDQPANPSSTEPKTPRAFLNENEELSAIVRVESAEGITIQIGDQPTPSVKATVSGDFNGVVYMASAGIKEGDKVKPAKYWTPGKYLRVKLHGKRSSAPAGHPNYGKISVAVTAAEEINDPTQPI